MSWFDLAKGVYVASVYIIENRNMLISVYGTYDYVKFGFYASEKLGLTTIMANSLKKKFIGEKVIYITDTECGELGEFDVISIS
jgi:hypothetical protein